MPDLSSCLSHRGGRVDRMLLDVVQEETGQIGLIISDEALPATVDCPERFAWVLTVDVSLMFCAITVPNHPADTPPPSVLRFKDVRANVADGRSWALAILEGGPVFVVVVDCKGDEMTFPASAVLGDGDHLWRRQMLERL